MNADSLFDNFFAKVFYQKFQFSASFLFVDSERRLLFMKKNSKQTSKAVATIASKILQNDHYGKKEKSVAGSALSQTRPGKK